jgi:hypothetical protein
MALGKFSPSTSVFSANSDSIKRSILSDLSSGVGTTGPQMADVRTYKWRKWILFHPSPQTKQKSKKECILILVEAVTYFERNYK